MILNHVDYEQKYYSVFVMTFYYNEYKFVTSFDKYKRWTRDEGFAFLQNLIYIFELT